MNEKNNVKVFSDVTGRVFIGEFIESNDSNTKIKNPMIIQAQDRGNNQMAIGCIPYTYLELFDVDSEGVWEFSNKSLSVCQDPPSSDTVNLYTAVVAKYSETRLKMSQSNGASESSDSSIVGSGGEVIEFTD